MPELRPHYNQSKREQAGIFATVHRGNTVMMGCTASPPKAEVTGSNPVGCTI
jgi:hypothetical protein